MQDQEGDELWCQEGCQSLATNTKGCGITDQEDLEPCHRVLVLDGATVRALLAEDCVRHPFTEGRVG